MHKKTLAACFLLAVATLANGFQTAAEWVRYTSEGGRYSVLLPRQPKLGSQEGTAGTGEKFTQYMAQLTDAGTLYWLAYFDYGPDMNFSLDKARDGAVENVGGRLLNEANVSLGGHPGRDLKVLAKSPGGEIILRVRVYDVGGRVYILQHVFPKSFDTSEVARKTDKFFDSFKVTVSR